MKRILSLIIISVMIMSLFAFAPAFAATSLEVDADGYSLIKNQAQVDEFLNGKTLKNNNKYKLMTDDVINISKPIYVYASASFELDGNGKTINLTITEGTQDLGSGFVGYAAKNTNVTIKNLTLTGSVKCAEYAVASVVGYVHEGATVTLTNVVNKASVENTVTAKADYGTAGLVGSVRMSTVNITNCMNDAPITTTCRGAGLVGNIIKAGSNVTIEKSANLGTVKSSGNNQIAGLLWGNNYASTVKIDSCYNAGKLVSTGNTAAIAGFYSGGNSYLEGTRISNCFNADDSAEFFAFVTKGNIAIENCYNAGLVKKFTLTKNDGYEAPDLTNCYYLKGTMTSTAECNAKEITKERLQSGIPGGLDTAIDVDGEPVWEYNENLTLTDAYEYPQLKGNKYISKLEELPEENENANIKAFPYYEGFSGTFAGGEETVYDGTFIAAYATAPEYEGYEKTYGIKIESEDGTIVQEKLAEDGSANEGRYGIIFYGDGIKTGTYTLTPYTTYKALRGTYTQTVLGTESTVVVE